MIVKGGFTHVVFALIKRIAISKNPVDYEKMQIRKCR